jgi:prepilin-type N-terminal cleavage/methylation domain-containing protein
VNRLLRRDERGLSLVETMVALAIIGILVLAVTFGIHAAVSAVPQTDQNVTDVVHAVANDARAAVAYDGAAAKFQNASWTEEGVKIVVTATPSTLTIVGTDQTTKATYQEEIPLVQEAVDPNEGYIPAGATPVPTSTPTP